MMKHFAILLILTFLTSCAKQPVASESVANSAQNSLVALENSLTDTCNTPAIKSQINAIKSQIIAIQESCAIEKEVITQEKVKWKWAFMGLAMMILLYILKKVFK